MGEGNSCAEAGPFVNPLFGDASTPQTAGQRPGMNPIWSPGDRPRSAEQQGGLPMPPHLLISSAQMLCRMVSASGLHLSVQSAL